MTVERQSNIPVVFLVDVVMGNSDALWTIPAGTTGTTYIDGDCFGVRLDLPIGIHQRVYAERHKLGRF